MSSLSSIVIFISYGKEFQLGLPLVRCNGRRGETPIFLYYNRFFSIFQRLFGFNSKISELNSTQIRQLGLSQDMPWQTDPQSGNKRSFPQLRARTELWLRPQRAVWRP